MSTEELLKQAEEFAKSDPKRAEQIYNDVLGEVTPRYILRAILTSYSKASKQRCHEFGTG